MSRKQLLIVCKSIHDIIELESKIKSAGIFYDIIPTPRHISSDCGVSIIIRVTDKNRVASFISSMGNRCEEWSGE